MKKFNYIVLSFACCALGMLYFAYNQGWILIRSSSYNAEVERTVQNLRAQKKQVSLTFWHHDKWNTESVDILETNDKAQTIQHLINSWLTLLDEDHIMTKKVTLQSAMISPSGQLYLSFDRNPFDENSSTHEKWMWLESLLKTIRNNKTGIQTIRFLVHHHTMEDHHLDFSNPWPIAGFLSKPH